MKPFKFCLLASVILIMTSCEESENAESGNMIEADGFKVEISSSGGFFDTTTSIKSTTDYSLGAMLLNSDDYEAIDLKSTPATGTLPAIHFLKLPNIGDQGGEGSCVAWATAYAARSIMLEESLETGVFSYSTNILSPEYVYNQIKISSCENGAYITSALNLLKNQGSCRWSVMPYTDEGCSTMPNTAQKADASEYKSSGFSRIPITSEAIKAHLYAGHPVVVGGPVNQDFMDGDLLTTFDGAVLGNHAYCIIGYLPQLALFGDCFVFQNSWGENWGFGNTATVTYSDGTERKLSGCGFMSMDYLTTWVKEAYVIND